MISQVTLSEARTYWKSSYAIPFYSWEWHNAWQTVFGHQYQPFYLLINEAVVAPFVKKDNTVMWSGGEEIADYLDLIGPDKEKIQAWVEILQLLHGSTLYLRNIPENSSTVEFFKKVPGAIIKQEDTTPKISLPKTWKEFVESIPSRKYRHELERKIRKFEREHIDASVSQSTDPTNDINILLRLMEKDQSKKTFLTPTMKDMFRAVSKTFSDTMSLLMLHMGDKYAAATLAFTNNNTYYLYNSGFDKDCCPNAGFYLKSMSIKHAIEQGLGEYNFLQGSERYKYELGGKDFFVYTVQLIL